MTDKLDLYNCSVSDLRFFTEQSIKGWDEERERLKDARAHLDDLRTYVESEPCECDPDVGAAPCMRCAILSEDPARRKPVVDFIRDHKTSHST